MELRPLTIPQVRELYQSRMVLDFPAAELKSMEAMEALAARGIYEMLGAYEAGRLVGYGLLLLPQGLGVGLLDYLAVVPEARCHGVGARILEALRAYDPGRLDALLLECEAPEEAPDPVMATRRLGFYRRSGAIETPVRSRLATVAFRILALPCGAFDVKTTARALEAIYRQMLPGELYGRYVQGIWEE